MSYHVKADHMGYHVSIGLHVSVCLPVALFLVYMVTHGASPRYHGASPITNAVFTLMRRFLVYMVTHGASPRYMNVTRLRGFSSPRSGKLRLQMQCLH